MNLLVWRWSADYDSPGKRRKHRLQFEHVTSAFASAGEHPAIGPFDASAYLSSVFEAFGHEPVALPFVMRRHEHCIVFTFSPAVRFTLVPVLGRLAMAHGLNSSEF